MLGNSRLTHRLLDVRVQTQQVSSLCSVLAGKRSVLSQQQRPDTPELPLRRAHCSSNRNRFDFYRLTCCDLNAPRTLLHLHHHHHHQHVIRFTRPAVLFDLWLDDWKQALSEVSTQERLWFWFCQNTLCLISTLETFRTCSVESCWHHQEFIHPFSLHTVFEFRLLFNNIWYLKWVINVCSETPTRLHHRHLFMWQSANNHIIWMLAADITSCRQGWDVLIRVL